MAEELVVPDWKSVTLYDYVRTRLRRHLIDNMVMDPPVDMLDQMTEEAIERCEEIFAEMAEEAVQ